MIVFIDAMNSREDKITLIDGIELISAIPSELAWKNIDDSGRLQFSTHYEAIKWLRKVVDYIPTSIKTFEIYSVFIDTIKTSRGMIKRAGRIHLSTVYANSIRQESYVEPPHMKQKGRPKSVDDDEDYDDEPILSKTIDPSDGWDED